jgi:hypothetical protein
MDWTNFLSNLQPETEHQGNTLLKELLTFQTSPDIFWYPGSGRDLVPLLLDVPNNPTRKRLYRVNQKSEEKPFLYWMNDYYEGFRRFPEDNLLGKKLEPGYGDGYGELWQEYNASVSIGKNRERYLIKNNWADENTMITLFTANVRNWEQSNHTHTRKKTGDEYLVCFSPCDSELLLEKIFAPHNFQLSMVALIAQGAFSMQRGGFNQYVDLPDRVIELKEHVGIVDFWCIDQHGQRYPERVPTAGSLREYEYIGGPLSWGYPPSRLYGRPGVLYSRETRLVRVGRGWIGAR